MMFQSPADRSQSVAQSSQLAGQKARNRSRISNGNGLLPDTDGRSATARRLGISPTPSWLISRVPISGSEARKQLIRRFAASSVLAEQV